LGGDFQLILLHCSYYKSFVFNPLKLSDYPMCQSFLTLKIYSFCLQDMETYYHCQKKVIMYAERINRLVILISYG
jgi:hypothetical protein